MRLDFHSVNMIVLSSPLAHLLLFRWLRNAIEETRVILAAFSSAGRCWSLFSPENRWIRFIRYNAVDSWWLVFEVALYSTPAKQPESAIFGGVRVWRQHVRKCNMYSCFQFYINALIDFKWCGWNKMTMQLRWFTYGRVDVWKRLAFCVAAEACKCVTGCAVN